MKNICITIRSLANGGAEKQSLLLAKALKDDYQTTIVAISNHPTHKKHLGYIEKEEINCLILHGNLWKRILTFKSFLRSHNITHIFSYLPGDTMFAAIIGKICGVRYIIGGVRNSELSTYKRNALKFIHNNLLDYSISNCYSGADKLTGLGFKKDKMLVEPNGIVVKSSPMKRGSKPLVNIVSVGRFVEQKDFKTALDAIVHLKLILPDVTIFKYYLIGYGELEEKIRIWISELDLIEEVELIINPSNIEDYYISADIYLCSSIFEGLSNTIMEAMSYSLPLVGTNVGDNNRLINDHINGFLVEKKDSVAMGERLKDLILQPEVRIEFGEKSYQILQDTYSFEKFRERYIKLIEKISK